MVWMALGILILILTIICFGTAWMMEERNSFKGGPMIRVTAGNVNYLTYQGDTAQSRRLLRHIHGCWDAGSRETHRDKATIHPHLESYLPYLYLSTLAVGYETGSDSSEDWYSISSSFSLSRLT